ncbi:hypothetical protein FB451DRAFT_1555680 [Mycena latifolia]|nr:hypothetical protein FB451DRAFT_1555680 [Mycena latifolia]
MRVGEGEGTDALSQLRVAACPPHDTPGPTHPVLCAAPADDANANANRCVFTPGTFVNDPLTPHPIDQCFDMVDVSSAWVIMGDHEPESSIVIGSKCRMLTRPFARHHLHLGMTSAPSPSHMPSASAPVTRDSSLC